MIDLFNDWYVPVQILLCGDEPRNLHTSESQILTPCIYKIKKLLIHAKISKERSNSIVLTK
jgi:hypothetical protein